MEVIDDEKEWLGQTVFWQRFILLGLGLLWLGFLVIYLIGVSFLHNILFTIAYCLVGGLGLFWGWRVIVYLHKSAVYHQLYRQNRQEGDWLTAQAYQLRFIRYLLLSPVVIIGLYIMMGMIALFFNERF